MSGVPSGTRPCKRLCAGGHPCCCYSHVPHVYHCCADAQCRCHRPECYGLVQVGDAYRAVAQIVVTLCLLVGVQLCQ